MRAWITRSFGDYVLKYRSGDLDKLRNIAKFIRDELCIDFEDVVY